jgi:hypothetical protein
MIRDVWTTRWAILLIAMAATIRFPAQAQENVVGNVVPTSVLILVRPGAHAERDNAIPKEASNVLLTLLSANSLKVAPQIASATVNQKLAAPSGVATPKSMTMLAISCC